MSQKILHKTNVDSLECGNKCSCSPLLKGVVEVFQVCIKAANQAYC